jgi:hypothetical protein
MTRYRSVMPGFVPGIHVLVSLGKKGVDSRDKPGLDGHSNNVLSPAPSSQL